MYTRSKVLQNQLPSYTNDIGMKPKQTPQRFQQILASGHTLLSKQPCPQIQIFLALILLTIFLTMKGTKGKKTDFLKKLSIVILSQKISFLINNLGDLCHRQSKQMISGIKAYTDELVFLFLPIYQGLPLQCPKYSQLGGHRHQQDASPTRKALYRNNLSAVPPATRKLKQTGDLFKTRSHDPEKRINTAPILRTPQAQLFTGPLLLDGGHLISLPCYFLEGLRGHASSLLHLPSLESIPLKFQPHYLVMYTGRILKDVVKGQLHSIHSELQHWEIQFVILRQSFRKPRLTTPIGSYF